MKYSSIFVFIAITFLLIFPTRVSAFQVEELPDDNLIRNPWFRDPQDPNSSSLDQWTDAAGLNKHWSSSQKKSNPTPDQIISGDCGSQELYCGTSARLDPGAGQSGGVAEPGVDAYLYQVIQSSQANRKLTFIAYWVSHLVEAADVSIYGGNSTDGPWELVWVPFYHSQDTLIKPSRGESIDDLWEQIGFIDTVLEHGYPNYKVEIHARLPEGNATGFKITGIYFNTFLTDEAPSVNLPTSTTTAVQLAPIDTQETIEPDSRATLEAQRTQLAEESLIPSITSTMVPSPTILLTNTITTTATSQVIPVESQSPAATSSFPIGFITGGLVVLLGIGGVFLYKKILNK